jgi:oxygen-dependent protoporphyrinogen oxidase
VTGVYACRPEDLLVNLAFPKLMNLRSSKSASKNVTHEKKSRARMMTPTDGMGSVIQALVRELEDQIVYGVQIENVEDSKLSNFTNQVWTIPAPLLSAALQKADPASSNALKEVRYSSLITATGFFDETKMRAPRGVGVLIPRDQGLRTLGVLYNSSSFPNRALKPRTTSLTFMFGGTADTAAIDLTDLEIKTIIRIEAEKIFGAGSGALLHTEITRWKQAIPLYDASLLHAINAMRNGFFSRPGRLVFANYSGQVSIRGLIESLPQFSAG